MQTRSTIEVSALATINLTAVMPFTAAARVVFFNLSSFGSSCVVTLSNLVVNIVSTGSADLVHLHDVSLAGSQLLITNVSTNLTSRYATTRLLYFSGSSASWSSGTVTLDGSGQYVRLWGISGAHLISLKTQSHRTEASRSATLTYLSAAPYKRALRSLCWGPHASCAHSPLITSVGPTLGIRPRTSIASAAPIRTPRQRRTSREQHSLSTTRPFFLLPRVKMPRRLSSSMGLFGSRRAPLL